MFAGARPARAAQSEHDPGEWFRSGSIGGGDFPVRAPERVAANSCADFDQSDIYPTTGSVGFDGT